MQTTITRLARARKPGAAAASPAALRLNEKIQAEARERLLADLSSKDDIVVLHGFDATRKIRVINDRLEVSDCRGNSVYMYRHRTEPDSWRSSECMRGHWHPARWYGYMTLMDARGAAWRKALGVYVCNDFGNLVEVAA